jgi:hypothetical protein
MSLLTVATIMIPHGMKGPADTGVAETVRKEIPKSRSH